jgi:serine/threonine-protein kinase
MAAVYAATHRNTRSFAIKMLHPELSMDEGLRFRFQREGYVANTVGHPGTVAVLDDDVTDDGAAFLVMELLEGMSIDALAEKLGGRLSIPDALGIVHQLLDVLAAAHAKGIVHRDIKPANLFLDLGGQVKVLDFGIARIRGTNASQLVTGTGTTMGTPAFMAPEQAFGSVQEVDARTDLWAVGATLFTLISGQLVHEGDTAQRLLINAATRPARSLASVVADAPRELVELVAHAVAFEKAARFASAADMRKDVERVATALYGGLPTKDMLARLLRPTAHGGPASLPPTMPSAPPPTGPSGTEAVRPPSGMGRLHAGTENPVAVTNGRAVDAQRRGDSRTALVVALALLGCAGAVAGWMHWGSTTSSTAPAVIKPVEAVVATSSGAPSTTASVAATLAVASSSIPGPTISPVASASSAVLAVQSSPRVRPHTGLPAQSSKSGSHPKAKDDPGVPPSAAPHDNPLAMPIQ